MEAIKDVIWHVQLVQETIPSTKHQFFKHEEESIMIWRVFSAQRITLVIKVEDIIYKEILKTYIIIYWKKNIRKLVFSTRQCIEN